MTSRHRLLARPAMLVLLVSLVAPVTVSAGPATPSDAEFNERVRTFLLSHPEVLREALTNMQEAERASQLKAIVDGARARFDSLLDPAASVHAGNPGGDVTLIEFLDYNCGYCKTVAPTLQEVISKDHRVRVIYRMHPILGDNSMFAAKMVLAAGKQSAEKQALLHNRLLAHKGAVTKDVAIQAASETGLDVEAMVKLADAASSQASMQAAMSINQAIGVTGTPTFVIGQKAVIGALPTENFLRLIQESRAK